MNDPRHTQGTRDRCHTGAAQATPGGPARGNKPELSASGLAVHDHRRAVSIEGEIAHVDIQDFGYPGAGIPQERNKGAVALPFTDTDQALHIFAGQELFNRQLTFLMRLFDVFKKRFRLLFT